MYIESRYMMHVDGVCLRWGKEWGRNREMSEWLGFELNSSLPYPDKLQCTPFTSLQRVATIAAQQFPKLAHYGPTAVNSLNRQINHILLP